MAKSILSDRATAHPTVAEVEQRSATFFRALLNSNPTEHDARQAGYAFVCDLNKRPSNIVPTTNEPNNGLAAEEHS